MIFISWTERVVMIDAMSPMLVSTITSLSDFVGHNAFNSSRELVSDAFFHSGEDSPNEIGCQRQPAVDDTRL